jgi:hypothetical protein
MADEQEQKKVCARYDAPWVSSPDGHKVGVARNVKSGVLPINGLRHPPAGDTTGWYIWAGEELSDDAEFFVPLHVAHLEQWRPGLSRYLGLAPGWRFLVDPTVGHEDVWEDPSLLDPKS